MSAFTFDFDLEDDLDESFDAIPLRGSAAVPSVDKVLTPERTSGEEIPAEELPLSALVSSIDRFLFWLPSSFASYHPIGSAALHAPRRALILASDAPRIERPRTRAPRPL